MTTVDIPDYDGAYQAKPDTPERFYLCTAFNFGLTCAAGRSVPLKRVNVKCNVLDFLAEVSVEQTFQNDDPSTAVEVIYRFPLDAQAILTSFSTQKNEGPVIHGKVTEKEEAKATYEEALACGQGGYLLHEEGELKDVFSLKVGNLQPGDTVNVKLTYVAQVDEEEEEEKEEKEEEEEAEGSKLPQKTTPKNKKNKKKSSSLRLVIPTAVAPRYMPSMEQSSELYRHAETALGSWPEDLLMLEGNVRSASRITHLVPHTFKEKTMVSVKEEGKEGSFHAVVPYLTEDFVLLIGFEERVKDRAWLEPSTGALTVSVGLCEDQLPDTEEIKGEFVFVIDRSGSMDGSKIQHAREALALCISALPEGSRFQIVSFGSTFAPLFPGSTPTSFPPSPVVQPSNLTSAFTTAAAMPAAATAAFGTPVLFTDETKKVALEHCAQMEANMGGTELLGPLRALSTLSPSLPRQVFLITDGQVGNTGEVLGWVRREGRREGTRFFAVGIGGGVSRGLVKGVGREGGGESVFVVDGERMQGKIMRQMNRAVGPAVGGSRVEVEGGKEGRVVVLSVSPRKPRPLFTGGRLLFYALLDPNTLVQNKKTKEKGKEGEEEWVDVGDEKEGWREEGLIIRVRGTGPGGEQVVIPVPLQIVPRGFASSGMLRALAVKSVLSDLEEEVEGEGEGKERAKTEAVALSVASGVLCKYTSFVAVEEGGEGGRFGGSKRVYLPLAFVTRTNMGHDPWGQGRGRGGGRGVGKMLNFAAASSPMMAMAQCRGSAPVMIKEAAHGGVRSGRSDVGHRGMPQRLGKMAMTASCDVSSVAPVSSTVARDVPGNGESSSSSSSSQRVDHVSLVARQRASGAWEWDEKLLFSMLFAGEGKGEEKREHGEGKNVLKELEARMRVIKQRDGRAEEGEEEEQEEKKMKKEKDVWATALVLLYLEKKWGKYEEEWEVAEKKAKRWLLRRMGGSEEGVQDVMEKAGKVLAAKEFV